MKSFLDIINEGFQSTETKQEEVELMLAQIVAETEYQSCLAELQNICLIEN